MENNEPKPQQTGGLKLMTVFIAVLALHVLVIGGFSIHALMSGGNSDADLVSDKTHKDVKVSPDGATVSEGQMPDATATDKSTTAATDTTGNATPMTIPAPANTTVEATPDSTASAAPTASAVTPAPVATTTTAPTSSTPSGPIPTSAVATPAPVVTTTAAAPGTPAPEASEPSTTEEAPEPQVTSSTGTGKGTIYIVKSHDVLARVAHRHHVSVAKLRAANGLKNDRLTIGERLIIPARSSEPVSGLAALREPNTTILGDDPSFASNKPVSSPSRHDKLAAKSSTGRHVYTVTKGDTLTRIAHKFHTSKNALMALNNISDSGKLKLGQKLRIPAQESRSATSSPARSHGEPDKIEPRATPSAQLANFIQ